LKINVVLCASPNDKMIKSIANKMRADYLLFACDVCFAFVTTFVISLSSFFALPVLSSYWTILFKLPSSSLNSLALFLISSINITLPDNVSIIYISTLIYPFDRFVISLSYHFIILSFHHSIILSFPRCTLYSLMASAGFSFSAFRVGQIEAIIAVRITSIVTTT